MSRTFGWIQNPGNPENLRRTVGTIYYGSDVYNELINERIPLLKKYNLWFDLKKVKYFENALINLKEDNEVPYSILKGTSGRKSTEDRSKAKCDGIVQAIINGQKSKTYKDENGISCTMKKPYTDDWSADGFMRWAITLHFWIYNQNNDTVSITEIGKKFVDAETQEEKMEIFGNALLCYPPVARVLKLLKDTGKMTKFEIGKELGFIGEDGFTSLPQDPYICEMFSETDINEKKKWRSNYEGSSDKYARMICAWLTKAGYVVSHSEKHYAIDGIANTNLETYSITAIGIQKLKLVTGKSSTGTIEMLVPYEMLATKAPDKDYLRYIRAKLIKYLNKPQYRTLENIKQYFEDMKFNLSTKYIELQLEGLERIGIQVEKNLKGIRILGKIAGLDIPEKSPETEEITKIKQRIIDNTCYINEVYYILVDYAYNTSKEAAPKFEEETHNLFVTELGFKGTHLGGSSKPDNIISENETGIVIDNKAYSKGFRLSVSMKDEMVRYLTELINKSASINPNQWWTKFDSQVKNYKFLFISSLFNGDIKGNTNKVSARTSINGGAINIENLLYLADNIKGGKISRTEALNLFDANDEIICSPVQYA